MAPKHGLAGFQQSEEQIAKRAKSSATPASRSATPADTSAKVPFKVEYPIMNGEKEPTKRQQELIEAADFQVSPFTAKGASKEGELDQYFTVTPTSEWEQMKKYNNFISELLSLGLRGMSADDELSPRRGIQEQSVCVCAGRGHAER